MKKIFLLIMIAIFALSGCGSKANTDQKQEGQEKETPAVEEEESMEEESEEDESIVEGASSSDVVITMPADYFEGFSEEEVITNFNDQGIENVTVQEDGSFLLTMLAEEHELLLQEMKADIDSDVDAIIGSMNIEAIKDASMNDNVTELIVEIDQDLYDGDMGGLVLLDFSIHAMLYQILNGVTEEEFDFEVVLVDSETGEEFERTSVLDE